MPTMTRQQSGAIGGRTRAANQTPQQRRDSARRAARASAARKQETAHRNRLNTAVTYIVDHATDLTTDQLNQLRTATNWTRACVREASYREAAAGVVVDVDRTHLDAGADTTATTYTVSCIPPWHIDYENYAILVKHRGRSYSDKAWAVIIRGRWFLTTNNTWELDPIPFPSDLANEWCENHRFYLDTALALAQQWAPLITVNGLTAADVNRAIRRDKAN